MRRAGGGLYDGREPTRKEESVSHSTGILRTVVAPEGRSKRRADDGGPGRNAHMLSRG